MALLSFVLMGPGPRPRSMRGFELAAPIEDSFLLDVGSPHQRRLDVSHAIRSNV